MAVRKGSTKSKNTRAAAAKRVTEALSGKIEQAAYDWVCDNFGKSEARAPSWNIRELAGAIASAIVHGHKAKNKVEYYD